MDNEKPKRKFKKWEPNPSRDLTVTIRHIMQNIKVQTRELEKRSLINRVEKK
jgi:hypothetical protein